MILSAVSWLLVVGAFLVCMIPLPSKLTAPFEKKVAAETRYNDEEDTEDTEGGDAASRAYQPAVRICKALANGHRDKARIEFLVMFSPSILVSDADIHHILDSMCGLSSADALPGGTF